MLVGAAAVPAAPLLAPGVVASLPAPVEPFARAIERVLGGLPDADLAVIVASGERAIYDGAVVDLRGLGRPQITARWPTHEAAVSTLSRVTQLPQKHASSLPVDAACLALHLDGRWPLVPVTVPATATWDVLVAVGAGIVQGLQSMGLSAVVVASGDGSAGLSPKAPRALIPGAAQWQDRLVDAIDEGATAMLERLGPAEAARVAARGWAPLAVLHGVTARGHLGMVLRRHGAPRGVGYVVAHGS